MRALTASEDASACIWDVETGERLASLVGHAKAIEAISFSPNDSLIATASQDATCCLWDANSGGEVARLVGHRDIVWSVSFSNDSRFVLTGSDDCTAKLWTVAGKEVATFADHSGPVLQASFFSDGDRIITTSEDGTCKVWKLGNSSPLLTLNCHQDSTLCAFLNRSENRLLAIARGGEITLLDAITGGKIASFRSRQSELTKYSFSSCGERFVFASENGQVILGETKTGKKVLLDTPEKLTATMVQFSPDDARLLVAAKDGSASILDALTGVVLKSFDDYRLDGRVRRAMFDPSGQRVITLTDFSGEAATSIWDASSTVEVVGPRDLLIAAALKGIGQREGSELRDVLMQEAPLDLFDAVINRLGEGRANSVRALTMSLRKSLHANCYLSVDEWSKKFDLKSSKRGGLQRGRKGLSSIEKEELREGVDVDELASGEPQQPLEDAPLQTAANTAAPLQIFTRTSVTVEDQVGQELAEIHAGTPIFRLVDGRYHLISNFAVATLDEARLAAKALADAIDILYESQ